MKIWWRLLMLFKPYAGWMLLGILLSTMTLFANIALLAISGWFIASMALAGVAGVAMNYFSPAAMIRGLSIARTAGRYAERLVSHEATFRVLAELRSWYFQHLAALSPAVLERYRSGDLYGHMSADIDTLDSFYLRVLTPFVVACLAFVAIVAVAAAYDTRLAWVMVGMLLLAGVGLPLLMLRLGQQLGAAQVEQAAQLRIAAIDGVQAMAELTVAGAADQQAERIYSNSQQLINTQTRMARVSGLAQSGLLLLANLTVFLMMLVAIPLLQQGVIAPADLAMLALFSLAAFESVLPLPEGFRLLGQVKAAAERLFAITDQAKLAEPIDACVKPTQMRWQFAEVDFRYAEDQAWVLKGFNFTIQPGEKVAVLGPTGAGKSTLIELLLANRQPNNGQVMLADHALNDYRLDDVRSWISVAPQKPYLFNASIRDNLRLGKPGASDEEIDKVCEIAQLSDWLAEQPDGLDTWVGETGVKLSGGQMRRLAIARALLKEHELLILDEPHEGLDAVTAHKLFAALFAQLRHRSLLMITHQQTELNVFDRVVRF